MSVPRLDLAPKLRQPLQLWNPLDYLRLLYWVFFFPQAIRWYVETFADPEHREAAGRDLLSALREDPVQRNLVFQSLPPAVLTPVLLVATFQRMGVSVRWSGLLVGIVFGVLLGVTIGSARGIAFSVAVSMVFSIAGGVVFGVIGTVVGTAVLGMAVSATIGVASGVALNVIPGMVLSINLGMTLSVVLSMLFGIAYGVMFGVAHGMMFWVAISHLPSYILTSLATAWARLQGEESIPHPTTPLPLPGVRQRLEAWLEADWEAGVHNVNQVLAYTMQFIPAVGAVNAVLERLFAAGATNPSPLQAVAELARDPYDWDLVRFGSASLGNAIGRAAIAGLFLSKRSRRRWQARFPTEPRLDTPARAACAGFWYLHERQPEKAAQAFAVVRTFLGGEEMYALAQALAASIRATDLDGIAALAGDEGFLQHTRPPRGEPASLLRPAVWKAVGRLRRAALEARTVRRSVSRANRSRALNRALGEINAVLREIEAIPQAERGLMEEIAIRWRDALLAVAAEVGEVLIARPVTNPYVVGDPVVGRGFVGREEILRRLEEYWAGSRVPPSVVLYGHRRMGKTSLLRNLPGRLGASVHVAYVNLLLLGEASGGVGDVLLALAHGIGQALKRAGRPAPPLDEDHLVSHPYRTFERFLERVRDLLGEDRLIVGVDEFEQLEEWMEQGTLPRQFLAVLRGYIQMAPYLAFAFAGLHTLEEMTADYFEPFFASVIPERVSFLKREEVFQVLSNPPPTKGREGEEEEFPLDYEPEALERVWQLTAGQPYLVQLIGHRLVRRFNELTFERGRHPDPLFTERDVDTVVTDPAFYRLGRYYFTGVWGQAARGAPGQQAVLRALAPHPKGLPFGELVTATRLSPQTLEAALEVLKRHDVVEKEAARWRFTVELMRRWVVQEIVEG